MTEQETKAALKEALKEWMDERFALVGKWAIGSIITLILSGIVGVIIHFNGWKF